MRLARSSPVPGPDPDFPFLSERERYQFSDPEEAEEGLVAFGGNLSPGMLLSAYEQGLFPWYDWENPILWHSPDPRFILFPDALHIPASLNKSLKKRVFTVKLDSAFSQVIHSCSEAQRPGQNGTWITDDMIQGYEELHRLGWAHSVEAYKSGVLVGGCYGLRLGDAFFGESMFATEDNASKVAFVSLATLLFSDGVRFIDCQVPTDHLANFGAVEIPRREYLGLLSTALNARKSAARMDAIISGSSMNEAAASDEADRRGNWAQRYPSFLSHA
ncbi:hypothetical protein MASR2M78_10230 [Treponema sp.]